MDFLTKEQIKFFSEKADEWIKSENVIIEAVDGLAVKILLNQVNKYISPLLDDELKEDLQSVINEALDSDWEGVALQVLDIIEDEIEDLELSDGAQSIIRGIFTLLDGIIQEVL